MGKLHNVSFDVTWFVYHVLNYINLHFVLYWNKGPSIVHRNCVALQHNQLMHHCSGVAWKLN